MEHHVHSDAARHEWHSLTITEVVPASSRAEGSLVEVNVPGTVRHPRARSTRCQSIYYCAAGELDFEVDGTTMAVGPGDVVVIEPGEWYAYANRGNEPARLLSVNVPPYDAAATEVAGEGDER